MDEGEVVVGGFVVAGCQPSGILELVEAAFDHVAQGIDCGIEGQLDQPVALIDPSKAVVPHPVAHRGLCPKLTARIHARTGRLSIAALPVKNGGSGGCEVREPTSALLPPLVKCIVG